MRGVEDDADTIIFVYRDEVYNEDTIDRGIAELIVAKNSEGQIGTVRVTYLQQYARFENFEPAS
jgi:replicative DNA helicase